MNIIDQVLKQMDHISSYNSEIDGLLSKYKYNNMKQIEESDQEQDNSQLDRGEDNENWKGPDDKSG